MKVISFSASKTKMPGISVAAGSERPAAIIICRDQLLYSFPLSTKLSTQKTIKLLLGLKSIAQAFTYQHVRVEKMMGSICLVERSPAHTCHMLQVSCARMSCEEVPLKVIYVQLAEVGSRAGVADRVLQAQSLSASCAGCALHPVPAWQRQCSRGPTLGAPHGRRHRDSWLCPGERLDMLQRQGYKLASILRLQGCRLAEDAGEGVDLLHRAVLRHVGHTPPPDSQVRQLRLAPEVTASPVLWLSSPILSIQAELFGLVETTSAVQVQIHADQAVAALHSDTRSSCCLFFRRVLAGGRGPVWSALCATMLGRPNPQSAAGGACWQLCSSQTVQSSSCGSCAGP